MLPYQAVGLPAMHPFTPTNSTQAGGSSLVVGGKQGGQLSRQSPTPLGGVLRGPLRGLVPALNPFVPTSAVQAGGQSSGYGGRGLRGGGLY